MDGGKYFPEVSSPEIIVRFFSTSAFYHLTKEGNREAKVIVWHLLACCIVWHADWSFIDNWP